MTMQDIMNKLKERVNKQKLTEINEKYLKPCYNTCMSAGVAAWRFIIANTPKLVHACKVAAYKGLEIMHRTISLVKRKIQKPPTPPCRKWG